MKHQALICAAALFLAACVAAAAEGPPKVEAPLKIVATQAVRHALTEIQPSLAANAGAPVAIEFGQTSAVVQRVTGGERASVVILIKQGMQQLADKGYVKSQADLAVSLVGVAVADDAPRPVLKTIADFAAFLKATPSIAYTVRGASGIHMTQVIEKLGLADVLKPKTVLVPEGFSGTLLREGKVAAAIQQISELRMAGARNIVPLPDEIQLRSVITAAVLKKGAPDDAAARMMNALKSPEAAAAYERSGLLPLFK
jgi:molybdate transport system substrate-binding protein